MSSRMDKYYKNETIENRRTKKNQDIYEKTSNDNNFDDLSMTTNISIIDTDTSNLDIDRIKEILDERYSKNKRRRNTAEYDVIDEEDKTLIDTKEYDLSKIIEAARNNKEEDYDKDRFKKLRDTQYDILKSLNLNRDNDPEIEESMTLEETNLMNLIKTVNENSLRSDIKKETDTLMDDLIGDENTEVLEPVSIEEDYDTQDNHYSLIDELKKTKELSKKEIISELSKDITLDDKEKAPNKEEEIKKLKDDFYTGNLEITDKDMDDFSELERELGKGNLAINLLIIVMVVIILAILIYLLNKYLDLGLF